MENYCWVTLLGTNDYIAGVIGLYYSLQKVKTKYPLEVMCLDSVSAFAINKLRELNISYKIISTDNFTGELADLYIGCSNCNITINKWQLFDYTQYDKVCFIDADIVFYENLDWILESDHMMAAIGGTGMAAGGIFTVIPKEGYYQELKTIFQNYCSNDEQILNALYLKDLLLQKGLMPTWNIRYYFHSGGYPKYWMVFRLNSIKKIKDFIFNTDFKDALWKAYNENQIDYENLEKDYIPMEEYKED